MSPAENNLVSILQDKSQSAADKVAYRFIEEENEPVQELTYYTLHLQAAAIATALRNHCRKGDRVLMMYQSSREFIPAFFGCLYAGVIAVPAYPPRKNHNAVRLLSIIEDAGVNAVLSTTQIHRQIASLTEYKPLFAQAAWISTDEVKEQSVPASFMPEVIADDEVMFLQYTSGSTGRPKGVMVTHANIWANLGMLYEALEVSADSVYLSWLPYFHDMGLIGVILEAMYAGVPAVMMNPAYFLQKPLRWLQAISAYGATVSGAPNFAYDLCVDKIRDEDLEGIDLSSWKVAFNGAEPVSAKTLDRFYNRFKKYGFNKRALLPSFGLAEATLFVSAQLKDDGPGILPVDAASLQQGQVNINEMTPAVGMVSCGKTCRNHELTVVDPVTGLRCAEGQVGELWFKGASVAKGYWNKPEETKAVFEAYTEAGDGPYLRTGDLAFLFGGEVYITGRLKDVLIIRGGNYYPQDLELASWESHSDLAANNAAAFTIDTETGVQLAIVQEVQRTAVRNLQADTLLEAILSNIAAQYQLQVFDILLLSPGNILKTSSGKIQRQANKNAYLNNEFQPLAQWRKSETPAVAALLTVNKTGVQHRELENWMREKIAELVNLPADRISVDKDFSSFGLDSLGAVQLSGALANYLAISVPPGLVYDYPSINQLAGYLLATPETTVKQQMFSSEDNDVAIIGMSGRFPGALDLEAYEQLLFQAENKITTPGVDAPTDGITRKVTYRAGYIPDVDLFDAHFFEIAPKEARSIDPQQRLMLELCYTAMQHAGYAPQKLRGSATGVFIGISNFDYAQLSLKHAQHKSAYFGTGVALSIAANRVSYFFDFKGPSLGIDTACSSSLVAIHQAVRSIRSGESTMALAGGVNLILSDTVNEYLDAGQLLAKDGHCKTFDASADGYVRGEGAGVLLLKSKKQAIEDGDQIVAVIKGSAVVQDGHSNGLLAPNGVSQQQVLQNALADAQVDPDSVSYIEAHGTGTALGDPIEVSALDKVFGTGRDKPLLVGSVKANIGHLESAAGIAGLIKTVICLRRKQVPPQVHFKTHNPNISWDNCCVKIPTAINQLNSNGRPLRAGVSSFGFGGTNAHVILEAYSADREKERIQDFAPLPFHLFTLSSKTAEGMAAQAVSLQRFIQKTSDVSLNDLVYSMANTRDHFAHGVVMKCNSVDELSGALDDIIHERDESLLVVKSNPAQQSGSTAFLFTGGGAQYAGMADTLYASQPVFKAAIDKCITLANHWLEQDLKEILFAGPGTPAELLLNRIDYMQPALFAYEYAMSQLWLSWGVMPDVLIGHSLGEIVAACIAGVFSLEDGIRLVCARGRLMQSLPPGGVMISLQANEADVISAIGEQTNVVSVAVINGPDQTVIAGTKEAAEAIKKQFDDKGVKTKLLQVSHASHSVLMDPILEAYAAVLADIQFARPAITLVSNATGEAADETICTADYWVSHLRHTVRFSSGIQQLETLGVRCFIEVGPHPVLLGIAKECMDDAAAASWLPSSRSTDQNVLYDSLARFYVAGGTVDWAAFYRNRPGQRIALPAYSFQRSSYWIDTTTLAQSNTHSGKLLLGHKIDIAGDTTVFETVVALSSFGYLSGHRVGGKLIVPGSFFCDMVQAYLAAKKADFEIEELLFEQPLLLENESPVRLQLSLKKTCDQCIQFKIHSNGLETSDESWLSLVNGTLHPAGNIEQDKAAFLAMKAKYTQALSPADLYEDYTLKGIEYGASFQSVTELYKKGSSIIGKISLPAALPESETTGYELHPVLLDGSFQLLNALAGEGNHAYLPFSVEGYHLIQPAGSVIWATLTMLDAASAKETLTASIQLWNEEGICIGKVDRLSVRKADAVLFDHAIRHDYEYHLEWKPVVSEYKNTKQLNGEQWHVIAGNPLSDNVAAFVGKLKDQGASVCLSSDLRVIAEPAADKIVCFWDRPVTGDLAGAAENNAIDGLAQLQHFISLYQNGATKASSYWWITKGANQFLEEIKTEPSAAPLWGLGRVFMREHPDVPFKLWDTVDPEGAAAMLDLVEMEPPEKELAFSKGQLYALRLVPGSQVKDAKLPGNRQLLFSEGSFDTLSFDLVPEKTLGATEVQIQVAYAGLNFRDIFRVLGLIGKDKGELGGECSGVVTKVGASVKNIKIGDQVMALAEGSFAHTVITDYRLVVRKPANMSLSEAATIPITFLTAWYGLKHLADMQRGERVLIHSAAGGVGMAAVQIVHYLGGIVYGTASQQKWSDVLKTGVANVYDSRTLDFYQQVLSDTNDKGVDIVLNSFIDQFVDRSLDLLSAGGRFLEIGKRDIRSAAAVHESNPGVFYEAYDLIYLMQHQQSLIQDMLETLVPLFEKKIFHPLPATIFDIREARQAFQFMSKAKHTGKLVLAIAEPEGKPAFQITPQSTVLITGGLGGLGIEVAHYLAKKYEIRHLLLLGRKEPSAELKQSLQLLTQYGTRVTTAAIDVTDKAALAGVIAAIPTEYPLKGVFHLAGMLDDGLLTEQSESRFTEVMSSKIRGTWHLHGLTQAHDLELFVLFSSAATVLGSVGQSNYAAANAFLDSFAFYRRANNQPACAISWGPWAATGLVHRMGGEHQQRIRKQGIGLLSNEAGIALLDHVLHDGAVQPIVLPILKNKLTEIYNNEAGSVSSVFKDLLDATPKSADKKDTAVWVKHLMSLPPKQRRQLLTDTIQQEIARILSLPDVRKIQLDKSLREFGMDSLMAVELRNRLSALIGKKLPVSLLFDYPNVSALASFIDGQIGSKEEVQNEAPVRNDTGWREAVYQQLLAQMKEAGNGAEQDYQTAADKMLRELDLMMELALNGKPSSVSGDLDDLSLEELENELENELRNI